MHFRCMRSLILALLGIIFTLSLLKLLSLLTTPDPVDQTRIPVYSVSLQLLLLRSSPWNIEWNTQKTEVKILFRRGYCRRTLKERTFWRYTSSSSHRICKECFTVVIFLIHHSHCAKQSSRGYKASMFVYSHNEGQDRIMRYLHVIA